METPSLLLFALSLDGSTNTAGIRNFKSVATEFRLTAALTGMEASHEHALDTTKMLLEEAGLAPEYRCYPAFNDIGSSQEIMDFIKKENLCIGDIIDLPLRGALNSKATDASIWISKAAKDGYERIGVFTNFLMYNAVLKGLAKMYPSIHLRDPFGFPGDIAVITKDSCTFSLGEFSKGMVEV